MTKEEKLQACIDQFLYPSFLDDNRPLLEKLHKNTLFMKAIRQVSENTAEHLLYGCNTKNDALKSAKFQDYKNDFCNIFFETLKFTSYPEYKKIYYQIKNSGYTGKSATISVYYAMVYLDLLETKEDFVQTKKPNFMQRLANFLDPATKEDPAIYHPTHIATKSPLQSNAALREKFEIYLIQQGYSQYTPSGNPSTVYTYIKCIDTVCAKEHINWKSLAESITSIISQYETGGIKENIGSKSHRSVINALYRYADFLSIQ